MKTIFVGPCGGGDIPTNGVSVKNHHILSKIRPILGADLKVIDTELWKKSPKVLLSLLLTIILNPRARYILSLNNDSSNKLIRILRKLAPKASVIYWVVGGTIGQWILEGKVRSSDYKDLAQIIVEGESMKKELNSVSLHNVSVMSNFKRLVDVKLTNKQISDKLKFVFLSRIIPEKGCDLILDAVDSLNKSEFSDKYSVDFYGPIDSSYSERFLKRIHEYENVQYNGFLDLRNMDNYQILSNYDAMLFPTFWDGEGCPGIVIDAYMCGLPILASNWSLNSDYIIHGKTGVLFEAKSSYQISKAIAKCIMGDINLLDLRNNAKMESKKYDIDNVLSISNLRKNKIIK